LGFLSFALCSLLFVYGALTICVVFSFGLEDLKFKII
jgi:hypothetical protein